MPDLVAPQDSIEGDPSRSGESRLLLDYLRPERRRVLVLVGVLLVAMLLPVIAPLLLGRFIDDALAGEPTGILVMIAVAYLLLTLTADGLQLIVTVLAVGLSWRVGNRLRSDLAQRALGLELAWHGEHSPGLLIERIDGDIDAINKFSSTAVLQLLGNAILLMGVLAASLLVDWRAGLLIASAALVASGLMVWLRAAGVPAHDHEREVLSHLYGDLEERLGGLEDLRANGAGNYAVHRLHEHSSRWWHAARRSAFLGDSSYVAAGCAFALGSAGTLALGVWLHRNGELSVGSVLVLFRFATIIREPLEHIAEQMREFRKAAAGARRASRLLATVPKIVDGTAKLPDGPLEADFDQVTFDYDPNGSDETIPVLRDLNLTIEAGSVVGVVGRTGSGKTSLGRLLLRFWDVTEGTVRLGGTDITEVDSMSLRKRVGVVTQEVELFRASLRDNLTLFGTLGADGDEPLVQALIEVGLGQWFESIPAGLDSMLEGDRSLSAGEAQLLALARVFLADPGIVVLDEASSRLDPQTEQRLVAATTRLLRGRTVVIIAHRFAALDHADRVLVIDHGRVIEDGDPRALLADPTSQFARLRAASESSEVPA